MIIDLHTHTQEDSACSYLPVEDLIAQAMAVGLDGVAVTDHSRIGGAEMAQELGAKHGIRVFRGVEVHTTLGDILVFGLYHDFPWQMDGGRLLREVAEAGAATILAHPYRHTGYAWQDALQIARSPSDDAAKKCPELARLTAVEVLNDRCGEAEAARARRLAQMLAVPGAGGSDAHVKRDVGSAVTHFAEPIHTDEELVAALHAGHYYPERLT